MRSILQVTSPSPEPNPEPAAQGSGKSGPRPYPGVSPKPKSNPESYHNLDHITGQRFIVVCKHALATELLAQRPFKLQRGAVTRESVPFEGLFMAEGGLTLISPL